MSLGLYILVERKPVRTDDVATWAQWFEFADRVVGATYVGTTLISTVFLGIDHSFGTHAVPLLFETMIFGGKSDGFQSRCSTWEQAETQHKTAVDIVEAERVLH